jgi:hypothetical protein
MYGVVKVVLEWSTIGVIETLWSSWGILRSYQSKFDEINCWYIKFWALTRHALTAKFIQVANLSKIMTWYLLSW